MVLPQPQHLAAILAWILANKGALAADAVWMVASASAFIKAVELFVGVFGHVFKPAAKAESALGRVLAFLDKVKKAKWLNALALTPDHSSPSESPKA